MNAKRKRFLNPAIGNPAGHSSVPPAFSASAGTAVTTFCMAEIQVYPSKMSERSCAKSVLLLLRV